MSIRSTSSSSMSAAILFVSGVSKGITLKEIVTTSWPLLSTPKAEFNGSGSHPASATSTAGIKYLIVFLIGLVDFGSAIVFVTHVYVVYLAFGPAFYAEGGQVALILALIEVAILTAKAL